MRFDDRDFHPNFEDHQAAAGRRVVTTEEADEAHTEEHMQPSFDHLSDEERVIAGDPADYDWDHPITPPPATTRQQRSMFSLRIDPVLYDRLAALAETRHMSFSELVRDALASLLAPERATPGQGLTVGRTVYIASTTMSTVRTNGPAVLQREEPSIELVEA